MKPASARNKLTCRWALSGPRRVHLDIVDYPGEWLLDLALLDQDYVAWSDRVIAAWTERPQAQDYLRLAHQTSATAAHDEGKARMLASAFTDCLHAARAAGYHDATPGRFLLPGDLADSPALTFAPLPGAGHAPRGSLAREMARRFAAYRAQVVRPFFRDHFARIDRQVVLNDRWYYSSFYKYFGEREGLAPRPGAARGTRGATSARSRGLVAAALVLPPPNALPNPRRCGVGNTRAEAYVERNQHDRGCSLGYREYC